MNIHEFQAKELLRRYGVATPDGRECTSADQAAEAHTALGTPVTVVKAQIHAGGRGKAGGVKVVKSADEAKAAAAEILGKTLVTHQTGPGGQLVRRLWVEQGSAIANEYYVGIVVDRSTGGPVMMASSEGGMDIEEVAANTPEKILKAPFGTDGVLADDAAKRLAEGIGLPAELVPQGAALMQLGAPNEANGLRRKPTCVVIPNGFDPPRGPWASLDAQPFRFIYCGRLAAYHKGLDLLARGFVLAQGKGHHMEMEWIGDGPDRSQLEGLLGHPDVQGKVRWSGSLFGEEKRAALAQASCFVLTSRHEGFPMALLEAASLGLPLLVSEGTHFGEYVRRFDCGLVLPELSAEAIADSLQEMASLPPERLREMSTNSVRLILKELNWEQVAERVLQDIYRPIAEAAR